MKRLHRPIVILAISCYTAEERRVPASILFNTRFASHRPDDEYRKLKLLVLYRVAVVGVSLCVPLLYLGIDWQGAAFWVGLVPLMAALGLNIVYIALGRYTRIPLRWLIAIQVLLDLAWAWPLLYFWGGVYSPFVFLLFGPILAAGILVGLRAGLVTASCATVAVSLAHTTIAVFPQRAVRDVVDVPALSARFDETVVFLVLVALFFHLVGLLSGMLAQRLERDRLLGDQMLNDVGEGVIAVDRRQRVVYANSMVGPLLGWPGEKLLGCEAADVLPFEIVEHLQAVLAEPGRQRCEITFGGREVEIKISSIGARTGRPRGATVIVTDLTERRRAEASQILKGRLDTLSEVAATIAHEIRNPITSIRGSAQTLCEDDTVEQGNRALLEVILRESDRIGRIVSDFLQLADLRKPALEQCSIRRIVDDVFMLLKHDQRVDGVRMETDVPDDLLCHADAEQLKQVFMNLGVNACEAINESGQGAVLRVVGRLKEEPVHDPYETPREVIVIDFEDDGPPIPDDKARRIFEPFFTTKTKGSGMGLAIARKIARSHGGDLTVTNLEEGGCRFTLKLTAA